jgi:hypothetical protein
VKQNESSVDLTVSNFGVGGIESTPTNSSLRQNEAIAEADEAAHMAHDAAQVSGGGEGEEVDMDDALYDSLSRHAPENYNWSDQFCESKTNVLGEYAKAYYQKRNAAILQPSDNEPITLFDNNLYHPRNAKSDEQQFLMHHHLYTHYAIKIYENNQPSGEVTLPPMQCVYIEGLPGTGKTYCIMNLRNMTRVIYNTNAADMASAPTGCAASLIHGSTNFRVGFIPTGDKFYKAPTNAQINNHEQLMANGLSYCSVKKRLVDEHSMMGWPDHVWYKHRNKEFC